MPKILTLITGVFLLAPLAVLAQERPLTPQDIKDKWVGKVAVGSTTTGMPVELKLQAEGVAAIVAGPTADMGSWRLSEQGFCTTWKKIRPNQERCYTGVVQGSTTKVFNPDGSSAGQYTEFK